MSKQILASLAESLRKGSVCPFSSGDVGDYAKWTRTLTATMRTVSDTLDSLSSGDDAKRIKELENIIREKDRIIMCLATGQKYTEPEIKIVDTDSPRSLDLQ